MAWKATDETVAVSGGAGPGGGWAEEKPATWLDRAKGIGQTAVDFATAAGTAGTFGLDVRRDAFAGWLAGDYPSYSKGVEAETKKIAKQRERSPYASIAGDVTGAALVSAPGLGGAGLAAKLGSGLGARALGYGAEGAVLGGLQGAGNTYTGNISDYLWNAGKGAGMGGILGAGGGAAFGARPAVSTARTSLDDVGRAKGIAYDALEANRAGFNRDPLAGTANALEAGPLYPFYNKADIPTTQAALERMRNMPRQFVAPAEIESVRKGLNTIPAERTTDIAAARHVKEALDNFYLNPPKGTVRPGTEAEAVLAAHQAKQARDLAAAEFRMQKMADMRTAAENQAASSWSGLNVENNMRQQIKNFVNPNTGGRGRLAGYTPEEQAALNNVIHRGTAANIGRWTGNVLAGGGGLAVPVTLLAGQEYFKENPAMALAAPAAGLALRTLSNRGARANIAAAENLVGQRNPLYRQRAATAPMAVPNRISAAFVPGSRDAITLEMLNRQTEQQEP